MLGLFFFFLLAVGGAVGIATSCCLIPIGIAVARKTTGNRKGLWAWFTFLSLGFLALFFVILDALDLVGSASLNSPEGMEDLTTGALLQGFSFCALPGVSALAAGFVARLVNR